MNKIIAKKGISEDLVRFELRTPVSINGFHPGQYIVLRNSASDPEIFLPVIKSNPEKETITVMVHATDECTNQLANLNVGSTIYEIKGPFGHPLNIENFGRVFCVGRGSAILLLLPVLQALQVAGNHVVTVLLAPTKEWLILQNEINAVSDELILLTDDGTIGENEPFCHVAGKILRSNRFDQVLAIGPAKTIKEIYSLTKKYNIPTQAVLYVGKTVESKLNGIFKVSISGTTKSVCIDGFNFNAYYPNFEEMAKRFENEDSEFSTYSMLRTR